MRKIGKFGLLPVIAALGFVFPEARRIPVAGAQPTGRNPPALFDYVTAARAVQLRFRQADRMASNVLYLSEWFFDFQGCLMSKRILVSDDDAHIRDVIGFALEKAGMQVMSGRLKGLSFASRVSEAGQSRIRRRRFVL